MTKPSEPRVVIVAGDVTVDWNLVRIPGPPDLGAGGIRGTVRVSSEPGGAGLLGAIVTSVAADIQKSDGEDHAIQVHTAEDDRTHHSFALWSRYERNDHVKVWRISDLIGLDNAFLPGDPASAERIEDDPVTADLVVLDAGVDFAARPESWPRALASDQAEPWVLVKIAQPVADSSLRDLLNGSLRRRMIAVVRANDLRMTEAQISRELSWERTAQDLMWELSYNPELKDLSRCAYLIVSFGTSGALLFSSGVDMPRLARLFFDPRVMEEQWLEDHPGAMVGYTISLTAAIARELMISPAKPDLASGIRRGLNAMRVLHYDGYAADDPDSDAPRLSFPVDRIVDALAVEGSRFADVVVPDPTVTEDPKSPGEPGPWRILEDVFPEGLEPVARRVVVEGPDDLVHKVPVGKFGRLLTADRQEIEGFRSIRSLIGQYAREKRPDRPLSIAVFGRPGSGKSFGIKQIALSMFPKLIEVVTFNLSQFQDPEQLHAAFHQVRDKSLRGKLPLIFWDEFDAGLGSEELGWLKHFLAPMQDGEFQTGQLTHHIGPAIFVFAGGTKHTMREFGEQGSAMFRAAKGPDFVSRLKGFVDILGPNPADNDPSGDPHFIIRRALLLRSMLESKKELFGEDGTTLRIDPGVLRAFLLVPQYVHGARSMESVIAMSLLDGKSRFERSCLPSEDQLALHVGSHDFLELVRSIAIQGKLLEDLAEAVHETFRAGELDKGASSTSPYLAPFSQLPGEVQEQNRDFVRDIPNKLAAVGYEISQAREGENTSAFPDQVVELLAEQEHDRWMRLKLRNGWSHGSPRDDQALLHPDLLPWRTTSTADLVERYGPDAARIGLAPLPDEEKEKDRRLIRAVTSLLAERGYRVTPIDR